MDYKNRLIILDNFISAIVIEAGCGLDLKHTIRKIINGQCDFDRAIYEWQGLGHHIFEEE